ncbi:hypothetical protein PINS_up001554 [Pythium insidiosum]|nr:hypothetical protein PINS_up001554 [Pythium insidiosum]
MASDDSIPNSHVPLTFLLGSAPRRLSALAPRNSRLPVLSPQRSESSERLLCFRENATLRQREALARSLLQELQHRSPRDRSERRREAQALLQTENTPETLPLLRRRPSSAASLPAAKEEDEDVYALPEYHGYAVTDPGFLSVAGDAAPIARASSLEELHQQEIARQRQQHRARQRSVERAAAQLRAQQAATKAALRELTKRATAVTTERTASHETSSTDSTAPLTWKERQRKELERARERDADEQAQRRRRVEERKALEQRKGSSERQRHQQPGRRHRPSAGPSYTSTLRTEQDTTSPSVPNDVLLLALQSGNACDRDVERLPPNRLRARQRELFVQSLTSVQLGGGFNVQVQERPRSGERETTEEREGMVAAAVAVPLVQTKRQVLSQWKATLRHATA